MKLNLTIKLLQNEAYKFSKKESKHKEPTLYGVTDGKAVGTYLEHKFQKYLFKKYSYIEGNAASGIDFPELKVDMKVTSIKQPQSSCPYKSAKQKIFGLGYSLLVFVYEKKDDIKTQKGNLNIVHTVFIESHRTADFQMTTGLQHILNNDGNIDDIVAFLRDKNLPIDYDIEGKKISEMLLKKPPKTGYLTISNALQWRLQYSRVIAKAGEIDGIIKVI
ncbi:MAG: restriction endonuclease [Candidatus Cloacimonetes bacterium]|nr:restriction endonuclease [Candidatus Cloacimonadota bacterium]MBL7149059.1 restriction endonuclease [Candidatus Cloacimonadota bacterium]